MRAVLMGTLVILATVAGRPGTPMLALALAAVAMTAQDPRVLNDAGFQLSFSATAGRNPDEFFIVVDVRNPTVTVEHDVRAIG